MCVFRPTLVEGCSGRCTMCARVFSCSRGPDPLPWKRSGLTCLHGLTSVVPAAHSDYEKQVQQCTQPSPHCAGEAVTVGVSPPRVSASCHKRHAARELRWLNLPSHAPALPSTSSSKRERLCLFLRRVALRVYAVGVDEKDTETELRVPVLRRYSSFRGSQRSEPLL